jgi:predicted acylesterase/phospholipase RssA
MGRNENELSDTRIIMPPKWNSSEKTFHLGINMAGAVSAGAYTAGVLDFLLEALEEWYAAKADPNPAVPLHDISLDVFSGASAGGMCAAIAAVMVQGSFEHIRNPSNPDVSGTTNRFYESWVNKVDIERLLQDQDLAEGKPLISLLDSTVIDEIADYALSPGSATPRPYISKSLTLFLALTNVRGTPFSLNGVADGSTEEDVAYYADRLQFETVAGDADPLFPAAKPLPVGSGGRAWPLLKDAAKATGAFPIFLAPRRIDRIADDYLCSPWEPLSVVNPGKISPHWPLLSGETISTLNVDGGVTDNNPFELAHDFLAIQNPRAVLNPDTGELENPRKSNEANCAVLTVAPFPSQALYNPHYDFTQNSGVAGMLPNLFTALISQSRFLGESLKAVVGGASFSRFVIAPSDAENLSKPALQCGVLSAFGGFFERGFRAHDYQLGRRNCQKFLADHFRLAADNPIMQAGLRDFDAATRKAVLDRFDPAQRNSLPLIPLCGTAAVEVPAPDRATITSSRVGHVVNWIVDRLHAVTKAVVDSTIGTGFESWAIRSAADGLISTWGKAKLKAALQKQLGDVISD